MPRREAEHRGVDAADKTPRSHLANLPPEATAEVLDLFLHESLSRVWTLIILFERGDREEFMRAAGSLRWSSLLVGADHLATLCSDLQSLDDTRRLRVRLLDLELEAERVREQLADTLDQIVGRRLAN